MSYQQFPLYAPPYHASDSRPTSTTSLTFDNGNPFQLNWLGVGANYMGFTSFAEFALSSATKTAEWDRAQLSGIKIARTFYDVAWAFGASYPTGPASYTTSNMLALYEWIAAMKARGINVLLNTAWSFTGGITGPFTGATSIVTPTPTMEAAWAQWLSDSLHQMINVRGYTNVVGLVLFTEPNLGAAAEPIPGGYTGQQYYVHMLDVLDTKIRTDDATRTPIRSSIKIIAGNEQTTANDDWLEYVAANDGGDADVLSAHSYIISPTFAPLGLAGNNDLSHSALITRFQNYVSDAGARPMWVDEGGTVIGGDTDSTGYRSTADAGWQMIKWHDGHMQAGCQATIPWTLQDEKYWPSPAQSVTQQYGVAKSLHDNNSVRPSWYAFSLHANLTGGGGGTKLHRISAGSTSTLYGTGCFVPYGVRNTVNTSGEWSFVVVNESTATAVTVNLGSALSTPRTFYRYTYSGEQVPVSASNPAYLKNWDMKFEGITNQIPRNVVPGRGFAIYSTMDISTPTAVNVAPQASVTTDSTGFGSEWNVINGNPSNVIGSANGWRKADDSSHYVELRWTDVKTVSRIELSFVGTTTGVVYATYTDTSSPTVLADYTLQYLSTGGAWTSLASITGNTSPNKTHTFASIQTNAIRFTVTSAAASANLNQIGVYAI